MSKVKQMITVRISEIDAELSSIINDLESLKLQPDNLEKINQLENLRNKILTYQAGKAELKNLSELLDD